MPWWGWVAVVYLTLLVVFLVVGEVNRIKVERRAEDRLSREVEEWLRER